MLKFKQGISNDFHQQVDESIPHAGEIELYRFLDTQQTYMKVGDGVTSWRNLPYRQIMGTNPEWHETDCSPRSPKITTTLQNFYPKGDKKVILVNLYGAPGAGKSTGAAYIFSKLKMAGVNAELVTEYAKDKVWEETKAVFDNQAYIFGKQYFRISRCADKVDVIVTDSPLMLSLIYNKDPLLGEPFNEVVRNVAQSFPNTMNFYVHRVKEYNPIGRFQNEQESDAVGDEILELLNREGAEYSVISGDSNGYDYIVAEVLNQLN